MSNALKVIAVVALVMIATISTFEFFGITGVPFAPEETEIVLIEEKIGEEQTGVVGYDTREIFEDTIVALL
ncbi:MAG: hypothetical protein DRZ90_17785, partial [Spirochaetes bacterium]